MNLQPIKIIVSHPRKQHAYELLKTFSSDKYNLRFYTTYWTPAFLIKIVEILIPKKYATTLNKFLNKRRDSAISDTIVYTFSMLEFLRFVLAKIHINNFHSRSAFYLDRLFDRTVSRKIKKSPPAVFIGYEMTSYLSFKQAKAQGAITILDLAQIHYKKIEALADQYSCLKSIKSDVALFNKINAVKQHEYELADYIFVLSNFARESLIEQHIPVEKIKLIHLGVNTLTFTPRTTYSTSDIFQIIFTGTLFARKGIHLIIEALIQLNISDIELLIIGATHDESNNLFSTSYPFKIRHIPYASHVELNNIYKTADIFILPSYLDSFGMVVTEAMATGTPVIVTSNTGASDFVKQGGGKVITIDSVQEIKNSILYYYSNRSNVKHDGLNAAKISRAYTWDFYRSTIERTIHEIINTRINS